MVRASRWLLALLLCAAPSLSGCKRSAGLTRVEAPAEGVTLRYNLSPGQVYQGSVRRSAAIRAASTSTTANQGFSFNLNLVVRGPAPEFGGTAVTARFSEVEVKWSLPPSIPISVAEFNRTASRQLQNLEVDLIVDDTGKILHVPELPADIDAELRAVLQQALDALETAFLTVPARPLKVGDAWNDDKTRGRKGKLGRYTSGTVKSRVDGFYTVGDPPLTVAKLIIDFDEVEITTTSNGSHEVKKQTTTEALFATEAQYLHSYVSEQQIFDPGNSNTFAKTEVFWDKPSVQASEAVTRQVQDITDPCDSDYVGAEECPTDPPLPDEPEAAAETATEAPAEAPPAAAEAP